MSVRWSVGEKFLTYVEVVLGGVGETHQNQSRAETIKGFDLPSRTKAGIRLSD